MKKKVSRMAVGMIAASLAAGSAAAQSPAALPDYLADISGTTPPAAADLATRNVLQLNTSMFSLYDNAGMTFRANLLAKHPVILALFSGGGGRMILYRPGNAPMGGP